MPTMLHVVSHYENTDQAPTHLFQHSGRPFPQRARKTCPSRKRCVIIAASLQCRSVWFASELCWACAVSARTDHPVACPALPCVCMDAPARRRAFARCRGARSTGHLLGSALQRLAGLLCIVPNGRCGAAMAACDVRELAVRALGALRAVLVVVLALGTYFLVFLGCKRLVARARAFAKVHPLRPAKIVCYLIARARVEWGTIAASTIM